jgi:hypothetical protein
MDRRLGGPQRRSGRGGEDKNSQPLPGFEPSICCVNILRSNIRFASVNLSGVDVCCHGQYSVEQAVTNVY